ncbi:hypothetical protein D6T70_06795 [Kurthia gibsonii]|uniref:hypothetical protein n=1 Tax=Kurthia gibsonii TaxID=33946 RepID=UPI000EB08A4D|nr:hypothetical protein [Kurthia gibsonii]RXH52227.1 hypothetical protein D6T70_06795 [Kurthia gibsonii]
MNNFKKDLNAEQELGKYLDEYFYPRCQELQNVERITDMGSQFKGIDVKAKYSSNEILIDEKGYLSIANIGSTFALELSYLNKSGNRKKGWLFDESKDTTHYLFCWNKRNEDVSHKHVEKGDFHYIMAMLVERTKLQEYLFRKYGIDSVTAEERVDEILNSSRTGSLDVLGVETKSKYYYSVGLPEQPINIVMQKTELQSICEKYYLVKKSELTEPKKF